MLDGVSLSKCLWMLQDADRGDTEAALARVARAYSLTAEELVELRTAYREIQTREPLDPH
jgi:NADH:ubiquinone oxidoreductase subunit E